MKIKLQVVLILVYVPAQAQIAPLTELAARQYSCTIPLIIKHLAENKLPDALKSIISKVLIEKYISCFTLQEKIRNLPFGIQSASLSPDNNYLLVIPDEHATDSDQNEESNHSLYNDRMVLMLNTTTLDIEALLYYDCSFVKAAYSSDGKYILTSTDAEVYIWLTTDLRSAPLKIIKDNIESAEFSTNGEIVLIRTEQTVALFSRAQPQTHPIILDHTTLLSDTLDTAYHVLTAAACSADGKYVLTGSNRGHLYLWDSTYPQQPSRLLGDDGYFTELAVSLLGHDDLIYALAMSADGRYALTGSRDTTARLWDLTNPEAAPRILNHDSAVYSVAISPNGRYALTGSEGKAFIWNLRDCTVLPLVLKHDHLDIHVGAFSPSGVSVFTGGSSQSEYRSTLYFWDLAIWNTYTLEDIIKNITNT